MLLLVWTEVWKEGSRLKTGHDRPGQSVGWTGGKKPVLCMVLLVMGKGPCSLPSVGWGGEGGPCSEGAGRAWRLGPRSRDSPGDGIRGKEETVSAFRAAGVYLCVCRLTEFYLRLDSAEGSPQMQTPC